MQDFIERFTSSSLKPSRNEGFVAVSRASLLRAGLLLLLVGISMGAYAQEICNNGLDDDNDGYVDCFDPDCSGNFFCASQFFGGPVPACQTSPPPAPPFTMTQLWATDSVATPVDSRRTPMIGDIDLDGIPEVITGRPLVSNATFVFNGANGALERTIGSLPTAGMNGYAIADIDNDGFGEILMVAAASRQLYCFEHNGGLKWSSSVPVGYGAGDDAWTPAIADFEEDGIPEIYLGNQIFNSVNGNLIASSASAGAKGANAGSPNEPFSVAADVLPTGFCPDCAGLELVAGNTVYSVNLGAGSITARTSITGAPDGLTSLGDIDRDGDIDAVVVAQSASGRGIVYAWDLQTAAQIGSTFQIDAAANAGGAITASGGLAAIDDVDRNGTMNVVVAGRNVVLALSFNPGPNTFTELWSFPLQVLSGRSGVVLFDFEGDNNTEVVVRDESQLYVLNAATGANRFAIGCASPNTRMETPVVADVDNNGQANIVCQCGTKVKAFQPSTVPWIATRTVFNQRSYYVLNIKDNLRIPRVQQHQERGFPAGAPVNFPFNSFMKQTSRLADNGALVNPAANDAITILNMATDLDLGSCQNGVRDSVGVRLTISNTGNATIPVGTGIAFYRNNPYLPGAVLLGTRATGTAVPAGASFTLPMIYVGDQGGTFNLYYQINDDGSNPIPISAPAIGHQECNFTNNMGNVTIINCGNLPPVIDTFGLPTNTIIFNSLEDQALTYCLSASDPQFDEHDATALIGAPTLGIVTGLADGDSCVQLIPNPNANGSTTFSIIVCDDGNVSLCDTVVFIWNIIPVNDRPLAVDDSATTIEDIPVTFNILLNDSDVEGNPLTSTIYAGPSNGTAVNTSGSILYTPNPNFSGLDTLWYQLCDNALPPGCDSAMVIILVQDINDKPTAVSDTLAMPNDTLTVTIDVQANDTDVEPTSIFTTTISCQPLHGTATLSGIDIVYVPDSTFLGLDSLCYIICDNGTPVMCDTAWVYLTIFNGNEAPIALNDADSTTYLDVITFSLLTNDSDPNGHIFDFTAISCGPNHGTIVIDTALGMITYTPDTLYLGIDTLCYVICDNPPAGGPFCDTAFVYITVLSDNRPPVAVRDTMTLLFNTTGTRDILANDSDPDSVDVLTATVITQPSNGSVLLASGMATYTPNPTFVGTDSFHYALCDNGYLRLCDSAYAVFTILPPNELVIPNGFSPNGDGINDFLEIEAILLFPGNSLMIFNRWGSQVFEANGYHNEWGGTFNENPVPDGTYFFRLDPGNGTSVLTGFILVYR